MQINFTGHHVDITPPLRSFTEDKLARLKRHFDKIISIDVKFETERAQQIAKATVFASGVKFHADARSDNMYNAVDGLVDKLDRQIKEHRGKETHHR